MSAIFRPLPSSPSTFAAGTGMSWKGQPRVAVPRIPRASARLGGLPNPGRSGVTRNAVTLESPPGPVVRAMTVRTSAMAPLVMWQLVPFNV